MKKFFERLADALKVMHPLEADDVDSALIVSKCALMLVNLVSAIERGEPSESVLDRADDLREVIDEAMDEYIATRTRVVKEYAEEHGLKVVEVKARKPKPLSLVRSREELMESLRASRELLKGTE